MNDHDKRMLQALADVREAEHGIIEAQAEVIQCVYRHIKKLNILNELRGERTIKIPEGL
jgi:hypothetical protein